MNRRLRELIEVLRCARLAVAPGPAVVFACSGAATVVRAFESVVVPLIEESIVDGPGRARVRSALLHSGVKTTFIMSSYSRMLGVRFPVEVSVLAGSFARLYDDLIDEIGGVRLGERLSELFRGLGFVATNDVERLLHRLFLAIHERLGRPPSDPVYGALQGLHEYQLRSRRQTDATIPSADLGGITAGKGGLANLVLCALIRPAMGARERALAQRLGELLQLLDDYVDFETDRRRGITTPATRGESGLVEIGARLREVRGPLVACYGGAAARQFLTTLYFQLVAAYVKRYGWAASPSSMRPATGRLGPLRVLLRGGGTVHPAVVAPEPAADGEVGRRSGRAG